MLLCESGLSLVEFAKFDLSLLLFQEQISEGRVGTGGH